MKAPQVERLFQKLDQAIPNPQSDLKFANAYQLLVAVILSAQATDKAVNLVTPRLFALAPDPQAMVDLGEEGIKDCIKSLGLFNHKAKNLVACAIRLLQEHQGQVPQTRPELEALAGVGSKTAGVVLNIAFGQECIPVDTHVFRLANRTGLVQTKTPDQTEKALLQLVPPWARKKAHHLLILHGRYVCQAKKPRCPQCVIRQECLYPDKTPG